MTSGAENDARLVLDRVEVRPLIDAAAALEPALGTAWLVGGVVRDAVLDRRSLDIDLAVVGDAHAYAGALAELIGGVAICHDAFGTATIATPGGVRIDLATARRERYPAPGALPEVEPAERLIEDLARRDFSANAIAVGLSPAVRGQVADPFAGLGAIAALELRILHPGSFLDDPTRILRGLRYAVRLGFTLDEATADAADRALAADTLGLVSGARVLAELRLAADDPSFLELVSILDAFGVGEAIVPGWRPGAAELLLGGVEAVLARFEPAGDECPPRLVRLAALWLTATDANRGALRERLSFSGVELAAFADAERAVTALAGVIAATAPSAVASALDPLGLAGVILAGALLELRRASCEPADAAEAAIERYLDGDRVRRPELRGDDVMRLSGLGPSPAIGRILRRLRAAVLDGAVNGVREEERYVVELAAAPGDEAERNEGDKDHEGDESGGT